MESVIMETDPAGGSGRSVIEHEFLGVQDSPEHVVENESLLVHVVERRGERFRNEERDDHRPGDFARAPRSII